MNTKQLIAAAAFAVVASAAFAQTTQAEQFGFPVSRSGGAAPPSSGSSVPKPDRSP